MGAQGIVFDDAFFPLGRMFALLGLHITHAGLLRTEEVGASEGAEGEHDKEGRQGPVPVRTNEVEFFEVFRYVIKMLYRLIFRLSTALFR